MAIPSQPAAATPQPVLRILVAVPTTGGTVKSKTATSLFRLAAALTANRCAATMINFDGSDVVTVRNLYANMVLTSDRWDALLFVDSDMEFDPRLVLRMIALNAGVCGVACTTRALDLEKYSDALAEHGDEALARAQASRFNVLTTFNNKRKTVILQRAGFYSLAAVGMAVCLIRKQALEAMVAEGAVEKRQDVRDNVISESYGFFDHLKVGDVTLLEDYSFCHRWSEKMQRKLWVCVDEHVGHIGEFAYGAKYLPMLESQLSSIEESGEKQKKKEKPAGKRAASAKAKPA